MTTPEDAVVVLNRALEEDPEAMAMLMGLRVPCNDALADDETIQVKGIKNDEGGFDPFIGLIGMINGIFGIQEDGRGYLAMFYGADGTLTHFGLTPPRDGFTPPDGSVVE